MALCMVAEFEMEPGCDGKRLHAILALQVLRCISIDISCIYSNGLPAATIMRLNFSLGLL